MNIEPVASLNNQLFLCLQVESHNLVDAAIKEAENSFSWRFCVRRSSKCRSMGFLQMTSTLESHSIVGPMWAVRNKSFQPVIGGAGWSQRGKLSTAAIKSAPANSIGCSQPYV